MIEVVYVEEAVRDHPRVQALLSRFREATVVSCRRYTEVFNPAAQNFRLQKRRPALILAHKHGAAVLEAPEHYGVGGRHNYYFSHMLNCVYDCRYCFLQGMYRSAHYVLFVNYEDFDQAIVDMLDGLAEGPAWFFSGYDCDSLAFEPVTRFVAQLLPLFEGRPEAFLELRTKSTQIRTLLRREPIPNVITAFSFTPAAVSRSLEHRVPALGKRISAMVRLQRAGWKVGLRLDPLIHCADFEAQYRQLFQQLFCSLDPDAVHSVSYGPFRLPRAYFKRMLRLYPAEPLFAGPLEHSAGRVSYGDGLEPEMMSFCREELERFVPAERLYPCVAPV